MQRVFFLVVEDCLDLAVRTEGVAGSVNPTIEPIVNRHTAKGSTRSPSVMAISGVYLRLFHLVFFYVVQAQRNDFEDDLHHYFFPIRFLFFSFHFQL